MSTLSSEVLCIMIFDFHRISADSNQGSIKGSCSQLQRIGCLRLDIGR